MHDVVKRMQDGTNMQQLVITVPQAADSIGMSLRWVREQIKQGELQAVRLGRKQFVRPEDLEHFIADRIEQKTAA
jgi:excisionase family DNA binding protein